MIKAITRIIVCSILYELLVTAIIIANIVLFIY